MIEELFKHPSTLARYQNGPFADERAEFLRHCTEAGYSVSMRRKIAWILLFVASSLDLSQGNVTTQAIELAVSNRTRCKRASNPAQESAWTRQMFIHFATEWVRYMGRLQQIPKTQNFTTQIEIFARYMSNERGLSPITIATRCERLSWFFDGLHPPRDTLSTITVSDVDTFIESKGKQGWTRASLAALASSLRSFFSFAEARGWCAPGITAAIESPRIYTREGIPEGPNWEEVQSLLASTCGDRYVDIRDHAILMLLALYGLRRGEVAGLQLADLDWEGERLHVTRSKQRLSQHYPLLPVVGEAILRYLRHVRPRCKHRALFLTLDAPIRPLSAASITPIAHSRLNQLGLTLSPSGAHCLRHACASHLLSAGFTLKQIGDHLGHRNANSTLSYTKVDLIGLRQVAELELGRLL